MTETTETTAIDAQAGTLAYAKAVAQGRTAWNAASKSVWTLARIAATVETKYADDTLKKLADAIAKGDLTGATLANYRTTWLAWVGADYVTVEGLDDAPDGDRRDTVNDNSFTVHEKFNALDDRFVLLSKRHWSAKEARALAAARKNGDPDPDLDGDGDSDGEGNGAGAESPNRRDWLVNKIAELEAKLLSYYTELAEIDDADDAPAGDGPDMADVAAALDAAGEVFIHTPRKGLPEHDASNPQIGCPDCLAAGVAPQPTERAGSPRRARRSRRQPAAA
jgi:hypothetical protein